MPEAKVIKEDISVELIGNYAFSKPLIKALKPDEVIIITSDFIKERAEYVAKKLFVNEFAYRFHFIHDELSDNPILFEKEAQALKLFKRLFADIADGDDAAFREKLLYKTPYYFKNVIDDKTFFDTYWQGGFEHYLNGISTRNKT